MYLGRNFSTMIMNGVLYIYPNVSSSVSATTEDNEKNVCINCGNDYSGDKIVNTMVDDYRGSSVPISRAKLLTISLEDKPIYEIIVDERDQQRIQKLVDDKEFLYAFQYRFNPNFIDKYVFEFKKLSPAIFRNGKVDAK